MKSLLKNKKFIIIGAVAVLFCIIIANSGSSEICGTWEIAKRSVNKDLRNYPEISINILENGQFLVDDNYLGRYTKNKNYITFKSSKLFTPLTYKYKVSGDTLMLRFADDEKAPKIYYKRVD